MVGCAEARSVMTSKASSRFRAWNWFENAEPPSHKALGG